MDHLFELSKLSIHRADSSFIRSLASRIDWKHRLIGIKGARGTGKTTLLLQYLKSLKLSQEGVLYVSLDDIWFSDNSLIDLAEYFYKRGGKIIALDEVHKYSDWSREIKNLYDRYPDLSILFTGSSIIEINRLQGDLSRRALMYELPGLSYREFLQLKYQISLPVLTLADILDNSFDTLDILASEFKPLKYFDEYLKYGYYPYFVEGIDNYYQKIRQVVRNIVEVDMAELEGFDIRQAKKMLRLLHIIAQQVPFKPNISSIAEKSNIHRNSINQYLYFLHEAKLITLLHHPEYSLVSLQKPEKIYLENTNIKFALATQVPNLGAIRESFFLNQVSALHTVHQSKVADFLVDMRYTFEIGGRSKTNKQIKDITNSWLVKADIEHNTGNTLPLWVFGLLY